ncbi:MAG: hypothetical protein H7070_07985 [Saprospiraceae bacterium]|nr:hypothetical protein [Pyrinomonadaceae bacterium]
MNGTYQYNFTGKFKGTSNEIKILALGKGKIKLAFDLTYPYIDATGGLTANVGTLEGIADISGDIATYSSNEFGDCKITITFVKPGTIEATQYGGSACGFGHNVSANGTYKKVTGVKPKI